MVQVQQEEPTKKHANRRAFFVGSFPAGLAPTSLALCRLQREARLTGRMRFCFAKFGRQDRKHFSSTWLACETSLLIQGVADKSFYAAGSKFFAWFESFFIFLYHFSTPSSNPQHPAHSSVRDRAAFSLRLGHARVLTVHRTVIHCTRAASLPPGGRPKTNAYRK